jgi:membrane protein YdbS with pleckstrin-like domain
MMEIEFIIRRTDMQIVTSKTREQFPLNPKKIIKKTITSVTTIIGTYAIAYIIMFPFMAKSLDVLVSVMNRVGMIVLILMPVYILISYLYQRWYFATYYYDLSDDHVTIRKSPLTPKEITIPYERIQDVYLDQDIWDRMLNIYDVHLSSATAMSGISAHIDGVDQTVAEGLRDLILSKVHEKIDKK